LKPEPTARLTAVQALQHPWLTNTRPTAPFPALNVIERLKRYNTQNKVKRIFLRKLAQSVFIPHKQQLLDLFSSLDPIHMRAITVDGLDKLLNGSYSREVLQGNKGINRVELVNKFESPLRSEASTYQITFSDFVAATAGDELLQNRAGVEFTFSLIDTDQDGCIRSSDLFLINYLMSLDIKDCDIKDTMKLHDDKLDLDNLMQMLVEGGLNEEGGNGK
jgi:calcium-dependent protein kinase